MCPSAARVTAPEMVTSREGRVILPPGCGPWLPVITCLPWLLGKGGKEGGREEKGTDGEEREREGKGGKGGKGRTSAPPSDPLPGDTPPQGMENFLLQVHLLKPTVPPQSSQLVTQL